MLTSLPQVVVELAQILHEHLHIGQPLTENTDLAVDLHLDSLQIMTFVVEVENRFKICLEPDNEAVLKTLGNVAAYVLHRLGEGEVHGPGNSRQGQAQARAQNQGQGQSQNQGYVAPEPGQ